VQALRTSSEPLLRSINVLMRPHPYNVHRWAENPVSDLPGVSVFPRQGYNPIDAENRGDFFDSLYHCAAAVGINTSAMIEAAIVGRPVCSILAAEFAGTQEGTIHFRHLLPENGGFLRIAATMESHLEQLAACLRDPETTRAETDRFVASFVRPHGRETRATPIFAAAVEQIAAAPAPPAVDAPRRRYLIQPLLLAAAAPVFVERLLDRDRLWRLRKWADSARRRARKRVSRAGARWKRYFEEAW
jgi:hypothetical protein